MKFRKGIMMIGFKQLQTFITVVEEKSFTKAAQRLYQTQPALSRQIKVLEDYLETKLFERREKEVTLTDVGNFFYHEAKRIYETLMITRERIFEIKGLVKGNLIIGASTLPGEYILPEYIARFCKQYPDIEVELKISDTQKIIQYLKERVVQIAFLGVFPQEPLLDIRPFLEDELVMIIPTSWQGLDYQEILKNKKLIIRERGSATRFIIEKNLSRVVDIPQKTSIVFGSTQAIIQSVSAGLGYSFVSRYAIRDPVKLKRIAEVQTLSGELKRKIYVATIKKSILSYSAKTFLELLAIKNEVPN